MSWLAKVSDIAGAAENLLNKLDEKTGDAIQQARDAKPRTRKSSTASIPATVISMPEHIITEDFGRPAPSLPSRAQSDYTGAGWRGRNYEQGSSSTQPGMTTTTASESWTMVLNSKEVNSAKPDEDTRSQRSVGGRSVASIRTASEFTGIDSSPNIKSQLFAKESQISVLKAKLSETEKKLEKRSQDYYEMKAEKEMLEKRMENQKTSSQEMDSLQELKLSR
uniref:Golgin-84 n=1 Tax=Caenorhabditis japonica TaxID=281687 RepID=A0A8R1EWC9_CAEJA